MGAPRHNDELRLYNSIDPKMEKEMSSLYDTLCTVRTALLNAVATRYIEGGKPLNIPVILNSIVNEIDAEFIEELVDMPETELRDLGFNYLYHGSDLMLFPIWLFPFIPDGTSLVDVRGMKFIKGTDTVEIYSWHWINVGLYFENNS